MNKTNLEYYLLRVGAKTIDELTLLQVKKIFLLAIKFFKQGEISLDTLSNIASSIWPIPLNKDSKSDEELKSAIHSCAEINFYIRKIPEIDSEASSTLAYLTDTFQYYDKHKDSI